MLAGGAALGQLLTFLALPVLTRLYSPAEMGVLSVFGSFLSMFVVIAGLCYEKAVPIPEEDADAANVVAVCLIATVFVALVALGALYGARDWIANELDAAPLVPYLWLIPISVLGAGFYQALNGWATRKKTYGRIARTKVAQSLGMVITQLSLGFARVGVVGLLLGDAVGRAAGGTTFLIQALRQDKSAVKEISWGRMRAMAKRFLDFPLNATWAALLHTAATALAPLIFAGWFGREVAGQYTAGQRALWAPMSLVAGAIAQVFIAQVATFRRESPDRIMPLFLGTFRRLFLVGLGPILILTAFGGSIFAFVLGEPYREAGVYLQIIGFTQLVQFAVGPVLTVLAILERQRWMLICDALGFMAIVGGLLLVKHFDAGGRWAMAAYGAGTIFLYGALFLASRKAIQEAIV